MPSSSSSYFLTVVFSYFVGDMLFSPFLGESDLVDLSVFLVGDGDFTDSTDFLVGESPPPRAGDGSVF